MTSWVKKLPRPRKRSCWIIAWHRRSIRNTWRRFIDVGNAALLRHRRYTRTFLKELTAEYGLTLSEVYAEIKFYIEARGKDEARG
jgi:hypothetical protein